MERSFYYYYSASARHMFCYQALLTWGLQPSQKQIFFFLVKTGIFSSSRPSVSTVLNTLILTTQSQFDRREKALNLHKGCRVFWQKTLGGADRGGGWWGSFPPSPIGELRGRLVTGGIISSAPRIIDYWLGQIKNQHFNNISALSSPGGRDRESRSWYWWLYAGWFSSEIKDSFTKQKQ